MADLRGGALNGADLREANLSGANLRAADLTTVELWRTTFADTNLSEVTGLESCRHSGLSYLDYFTLVQSGSLPLPFLRGCGLPDEFIEYLPSLLNQPIQFDSCFISYSTKDQDFADRLYADLQNRGVRCWFAPHKIQGGKKLHEQIDDAIRLYDRLLLILSAASMNSEWVRTEIAKARRRELHEQRRMLFPVRLVDFETLRDWECFDADTGKDSAREIREYFVPDFSNWKDNNSYCTAFERLIADLRTERPAPFADYAEIKNELDEAREEISNYRCPYCAAPLAVRLSAPTDPEEKDWGERESFACGFQHFDGIVERPCPADPNFPRFEDYELYFDENQREPHFKWQCHALGKTEMARKLHLTRGLGTSKEEAQNQVRESYNRSAKRMNSAPHFR